MTNSELKKITLDVLHQKKAEREKIACLTAYDASFARVLENAGVDVILVGDSLGMVVQGWDTTVPVSVADVVYHCACVARNIERPLIMADLPFMSYRTVLAALENAAALMQEGGAHIVKLESGEKQIEIIRAFAECGIPVCAHLGLRPQWIHKLGRYKVQARESFDAKVLSDTAEALAEAGADMLLLECVPAELGKRISDASAVPVIGIGAGVDCDGQVLVTHDMLGITHYLPKFARNFLAEHNSIEDAAAAYVNEVRAGTFPDDQHTYR